MIKVTALTSGENDPSSRFRVRQYIKPLHESGIFVRECIPFINKYSGLPFWPKNKEVSFYALPLSFLWQMIKLSARLPGIADSRRSDITWLGRELLPGYHTFERFLKRPLVFDIDDAIWTFRTVQKQPITSIVERSDAIIAGNAYIADWCSGFSKRIHIIPTAVDTQRYKPDFSNKKFSVDKFVIGWIGTSYNLPYLRAIEKVLSKFTHNHPDTEILVIADMPPAFKHIPLSSVNYLKWSPDIEVEAICNMDVGIMPLPDNEWTRGKCSFKVLQYMACSIPVIASPVGMNREVLQKGEAGLNATTDDDWYDALSFFYKNRTSSKTFGEAGRRIVENYYSTEIISGRIAEIFRGLVKSEKI